MRSATAKDVLISFVRMAFLTADKTHSLMYVERSATQRHKFASLFLRSQSYKRNLVFKKKKISLKFHDGAIPQFRTKHTAIKYELK